MRRQRVIVEYDDGEWLSMTERGDVDSFETAQAAFNAIQRRARRGNRTVTVTTIEWRNAPDGFVPPKEVRNV